MSIGMSVGLKIGGGGAAIEPKFDGKRRPREGLWAATEGDMLKRCRTYDNHKGYASGRGYCLMEVEREQIH